MIAEGHQLLNQFCNKGFYHFMITFNPIFNGWFVHSKPCVHICECNFLMCKLPAQIQAETSCYKILIKKWRLDIFHLFSFGFSSLQYLHVAFWQTQVYNSHWFFWLLEKGVCFRKYLALSIHGHFWQLRVGFFVYSNSHLVGQSDTTLAKRAPAVSIGRVIFHFLPFIIGTCS